MVGRKKLEEEIRPKPKSQSAYPAMLDRMADEGITSYEANLADGSISYHDRDSERRERLPVRRRAEGMLNRDSLKDAWVENNYTKFLSEIARAGVESYKVDIAARTITYFGAGGSYTEVIPRSK